MVAKTKREDAPAPIVGPIGGNAQQALISFVERIERVREEIDVSNEDLKEIFAEAKGDGFDTAIIRKVIAIRRMDPSKRKEQAELIDLYLHAIGGEV